MGTTTGAAQTTGSEVIYVRANSIDTEGTDETGCV
jgi:hypothetical protein